MYKIDAINGQITKNDRPLKKREDIHTALKEIIVHTLAAGESIDEIPFGEGNIPDKFVVEEWEEQDPKYKVKLHKAKKIRIDGTIEKCVRAVNRYEETGRQEDKGKADSIQKLVDQLKKYQEDKDPIVNLNVDRVFPEGTWKDMVCSTCGEVVNGKID